MIVPWSLRGRAGGDDGRALNGRILRSGSGDVGVTLSSRSNSSGVIASNPGAWRRRGWGRVSIGRVGSADRSDVRLSGLAGSLADLVGIALLRQEQWRGGKILVLGSRVTTE